MKTLRDYEDELTEEYKDWVVQGRLTRVNITTLAEAAMLRDHAEAIEKLEKRVGELEEKSGRNEHFQHKESCTRLGGHPGYPCGYYFPIQVNT